MRSDSNPVTQLIYAAADSHKSKHWTNHATTWAGFAQQLRGQAVVAQDKRSRGGFTLTEFGGTEPGERTAKRARARYGLALDFDTAPKHLTPSLSYAHVAYETASSTDAEPRWRVVVPFSQPVPAAQWKGVAQRIAGELMADLQECAPGEWELDTTSLGLVQLTYWPTMPTEAALERFETTFSDQSDQPLYDPLPGGVVTKHDLAQPVAATSPLWLSETLPGAVAQLAVSDPVAFFACIPGQPYKVHEQTGDDVRASYRDGSGEAGLVMHLDTGHIDIHHATDPVREYGYDLSQITPFDLMRVWQMITDGVSYAEDQRTGTPAGAVGRRRSDMRLGDLILSGVFIDVLRVVEARKANKTTELLRQAASLPTDTPEGPQSTLPGVETCLLRLVGAEALQPTMDKNGDPKPLPTVVVLLREFFTRYAVLKEGGSGRLFAVSRKTDDARPLDTEADLLSAMIVTGELSTWTRAKDRPEGKLWQLISELSGPRFDDLTDPKGLLFGSRAVQDGSTVYVDLAQPGNRKCVRVNPFGWELLDTPPPHVFFSRVRTEPLATPTRHDVRESSALLRKHLGVDDAKTWAVLLTWLASALIPTYARPFLWLLGSPGSGKTTLGSRMLALTDPAPGGNTSVDKGSSKDRIARFDSLRNDYVLTGDNLNGASIDDHWNSTMAKVFSGQVVEERGIYSKTAMRVFVQRTALFTAIGMPHGVAGDVKDRSYIVHLPRRATFGGPEFVAEWEHLQGQAQGLVFSMMGAMLAGNTERGLNLHREKLIDTAGQAPLTQRATQVTMALPTLGELLGVDLWRALMDSQTEMQAAEAGEANIFAVVVGYLAERGGSIERTSMLKFARAVHAHAKLNQLPGLDNLHPRASVSNVIREDLEMNAKAYKAAGLIFDLSTYDGTRTITASITPEALERAQEMTA